ncbi:HAMP domain-containing histidine kinase [Luteolibacter arcticus]|uniref:histidine kinase n=1 Tax=Luteolibacter arcticus TaxID=1581411 RepID=A0ABT3GSX0_9BACT|nr:HAMP domain-containing sensor histidine kinase [Luteolibacter arcticus]MCW1926623.1 HAMP domain-containing histidine kinase [Luteolibacter arcticus]
MPRRRPPSLLVAWLAVVIPLITLGVFAWRGIEAQAYAIRREKQAETEYLVKQSAKELTRRLQGSVVEIRTYPDPPRPGNPAPEDAILDGSDRDALVALRDRADAGLSPAGLPRRVLAALRLTDFTSSPGAPLPSGEVAPLVRLVTEECPSVLTSLVLENLLPASGADLDLWEKQMEMVEMSRRHPEGGLIMEDDYVWLGARGERIRYVSSEAIAAVLGDLRGGPYMVWLTREPVTDTGLEDPFVSASAKVEMDAGFWLHMRLIPSAAIIDTAIRNQKKWAASLLGVAAMVSFGGLFMLHRTLRRERQLNEMKSQFVASVSHELRAPVASIRLMADALEAEKVAPETAKEFHRLIAREGARLSTLVGNVLDHARIEQGRKVWRMEPCDLSALVADTVRVMEPLANEKSIGLKVELSPVEATVDADAIQQALVNLLDNAIKFSPPGSEVTTVLACYDERRTWRLCVRDEGPGIPKDEQSRIFERFYRPGDELRRETQGTGIGLSLVKSIAEAHGGRVTVESELGRGSVFVFAGSAGLEAGSLDHSGRSENRRSREQS